MNKIRIAKAAVNGKEYLILITLDPDGKKVCMTILMRKTMKECGRNKQELEETCTTSPTSHSCLATNKQILLKDEIKQIKLRIEDNGY